jgi:hypothetical protein
VFAVLVFGLAAVSACKEAVTAPGTCPEFCPSRRVEAFDSVFAGSIVRDSSYRGYILGYQAPLMQVVTEGSAPESRSVIRYIAFQDTIPNKEIISRDSFEIELQIVGLSDPSDSLELRVHRLPVTVDTGTTWAEADPYFDDSTLVATIALPDTIVVDENTAVTVSAAMPLSAFPTFEQDGNVAAVGVSLRATAEGYVDIGTDEGVRPSLLLRWFTTTDTTILDSIALDSLGLEPEDSLVIDTVAQSEARLPEMDKFVALPWAAEDPDANPVGGSPSARALLRVDLPDLVIDSSEISRATLILVPSEPVLGAPTDTVRLRADFLTADVGAKSPVLALADTFSIGAVDIPVGWDDTVRLEVTHILSPLRVDSLLPAAIVLRLVPEGGVVGEARFWSDRAPAGSASLQVTYTPVVPRSESQ